MKFGQDGLRRVAAPVAVPDEVDVDGTDHHGAAVIADAVGAGGARGGEHGGHRLQRLVRVARQLPLAVGLWIGGELVRAFVDRCRRIGVASR